MSRSARWITASSGLVFEQLGEADTDRSARDRLREDLGDVAEAAFREREARVDQRAHELVTAVAREHVVRTEALAQGQTDFLQQTIAVGVTALVVDPLQMVDVEEGDDQRFPGSVGPSERLPELVAAGAA